MGRCWRHLGGREASGGDLAFDSVVALDSCISQSHALEVGISLP